MSLERMYGEACAFINKGVEIECHGGVIHRGIVHSVDRELVYLRPLDDFDGPGSGGLDHPGLFVGGWGFPGAFAGGFAGALTGVALANVFAFRPYPYPYFY